jgi:tellurite resistance protein TerC
MFSRLKFGLAIILVFIGIKMISAPIYHFSSTNSLAVVGSILLVSIVASVIWPEKEAGK